MSSFFEPAQPAGWYLNLYPDAKEATATFIASYKSLGKSTFDESPFSERGPIEAARRARSKVRRYCAANSLNRLGTLTYRDEGMHDQKEFRSDIGAFFKELKASLNKPFPYLWVPEWHPSGHGLHAHFAINRYIKRSLIESVWDKGFVHIKLLSDIPHGSTTMQEARRAAYYLGKYVGKTFEDKNRIKGMHRYDIAQGFMPRKVVYSAPNRYIVIQEAIDAMGSVPSYTWDSNDQKDWSASPAMYMSW